MKKLIVVFFSIILIVFCGFKRKSKPIIILSSNQITQESVNVIENTFNSQSKIFYALYAPDGFKYPAVRIQISKQDEKTSNWGLSIVTSRDIYLDMAQKVYRDYIFVQKKGHYIIQFFYLNKKNYPFAHREFRVN